ncbi:hypothetical protein BH10ACT11_BH10ACT11_05240 [soil metagenome]
MTVAAGGSALVLTACGAESDPNADKSDTELLGYIRELQSEIADGWNTDSKGSSKADAETGLSAGSIGQAFAKQSKELLDELDNALADAGSSQPPQATFTQNLDVGSVDGYEPFLIGVVNGVIPSLSSEKLRLLAYRVAAASAGRLAAFNQSEGKDPSPDAFVLGEYPPGFKAVAQ